MDYIKWSLLKIAINSNNNIAWNQYDDDDDDNERNATAWKNERANEWTNITVKLNS